MSALRRRANVAARRAVTGLVLVTLLFVTGLVPVSSQRADAVGLPPPRTAREAVDRFAEVCGTIRDYQVRLYEWCRSGSRYERRIIDFYFKRPRMIRMDIITGNRPLDAGSVGVYTGGDRVDGRKGGILSAIVLSVNKHDGLATTIRGVTFDQSDLEGILERLQNGFTIGAVTLEHRDGWHWVHILPRDPAGYGGVSRETVAFDPATFLPVYSESFMGAVQVEYARWTGYIINAGLPDALFQIRTDSSILTAAGVPTIHGTPTDDRYFSP